MERPLCDCLQCNLCAIIGHALPRPLPPPEPEDEEPAPRQPATQRTIFDYQPTEDGR